MGAALDVHLHYDRGVPVLMLAGELDVATAPYLQQRGRQLADTALGEEHGIAGGDVARTPVLVMNASKVAFIDSAGLGAVIAVLKCVRSHRAGFSIAEANLEMRRLVASTGLDQVLMLHDSTAEAVDAVVGSPGR